MIVLTFFIYSTKNGEHTNPVSLSRVTLALEQTLV